MSLLDDIIARTKTKPASVRREVLADAARVTARMKWVPNPGPQTQAYHSQADVLLYGGEPGGGKSQLIAGLAYNEHKRSLIMRRQYGDLGRIVDETRSDSTRLLGALGAVADR